MFDNLQPATPVINGGSYAQGGTTMPRSFENVPTTMLPLDELSQTLAGNQAAVSTMVDRVHALADKLFGVRPPQPQGTEARKDRSGVVGSLNDQADNLRRGLEELRSALARFEPLA